MLSETYVNEMALGRVETAIKMLYPRLLCELDLPVISGMMATSAPMTTTSTLQVCQ